MCNDHFRIQHVFGPKSSKNCPGNQWKSTKSMILSDFEWYFSDFPAPVCKLVFAKALRLINIFCSGFFYHQVQLRSDSLKQFPVCFAVLVAPHIDSSDGIKQKIMIFWWFQWKSLAFCWVPSLESMCGATKMAKNTENCFKLSLFSWTWW